MNHSVKWIVGAAVVSRLLLVLFDPSPGGPQPLEPSVMAANLQAGRGYVFEQYGATYRAWKEPLYIVLLSWVTAGPDNQIMPVVFFQSLCGLGVALAVAWLARMLLGHERHATIAGVLAAANPFLVYYDTQFIHPLSFDVLLFLMIVGTIVMAVRRGMTRRWVLVAALAMGAALWQRAALVASGLFCWLAVWLSDRPTRGTTLRATAMWLAICAIVISPWLIRNYRLFGRVIMTTDSAHILWLGNNAWSNGTYSDQQGMRWLGYADPVFRQQLAQATELEQYDLFLQDVHRFIKADPERFATLLLQKLWAFIWFSPNAGFNYASWQASIYQGWYLGILVMGLVGLALAWRRGLPAGRRLLAITLASGLGLAAVHMLTAVNLKHRVPIEMLLAVCTAETLARGYAAIRQRRQLHPEQGQSAVEAHVESRIAFHNKVC